MEYGGLSSSQNTLFGSSDLDNFGKDFGAFGAQNGSTSSFNPGPLFPENPLNNPFFDK